MKESQFYKYYNVLIVLNCFMWLITPIAHGILIFKLGPEDVLQAIFIYTIGIAVFITATLNVMYLFTLNSYRKQL